MAPGSKTPSSVDTLKPPNAFKSHIEQCYHIQDTCYERRASGNRRTLNYAIFNIYTCFDVKFSHYYVHGIVLCILVIIKNVIYHANI